MKEEGRKEGRGRKYSRQAPITSSITLKKKDHKAYHQIDDTVASCTTPLSNDTHYAPHFMRKIRQSGSQKHSVKQFKGTAKLQFPPSLQVDRVFSSPNGGESTG